MARQQYKLGERQVDEARKRVAARASPRIEITRAESGMASLLGAIIVSETNVRMDQRELKRVMNRPDLPIESPTDIVLSSKPRPLGLSLSPESLTAQALRNRMEMFQLEIQLAMDADTINYQRNQLLPSLMLDYDYELLRPGNTLGQSLQVTRGHNTPSWSVGLSASIPIGNDAAKANLHQAILTRVQRLLTRDQQRLAIRQEVYNAIDQLDESWREIIAARNESVLAGRTYQAELAQFKLGVRTSTDVLYAAAQLASAQSLEFQALAAYEIAKVNIAFATGTVLGEGRVILKPVVSY